MIGRGRALILAVALALAACVQQPGSLNDHPYRDMPSGPGWGSG
jgi:hypothetical protein